MITEPVLFRDLAYVFLAAVVGGALARLARQPLILGYVLGGLLVSPLTPGPSVSDVPTFERFAEIGVVLLMFSLGIEFSLKDLTPMRSDRKSTRLNSSHSQISYAVFCLKKKK